MLGGDAVAALPCANGTPSIGPFKLQIGRKILAGFPKGYDFGESVHVKLIHGVSTLINTKCIDRPPNSGDTNSVAMEYPELPTAKDRLHWACAQKKIYDAAELRRVCGRPENDSTIRSAYNGSRTITAPMAKEFARVLGVPWFWLLHGFEPLRQAGFVSAADHSLASKIARLDSSDREHLEALVNRLADKQ